MSILVYTLYTYMSYTWLHALFTSPVHYIGSCFVLNHIRQIVVEVIDTHYEPCWKHIFCSLVRILTLAWERRNSIQSKLFKLTEKGENAHDWLVEVSFRGINVSQIFHSISFTHTNCTPSMCERDEKLMWTNNRKVFADTTMIQLYLLIFSKM